MNHRYLLCECCDFLGVLPPDVDPARIICPLCVLAKCNETNQCVELNEKEFMVALESER